MRSLLSSFVAPALLAGSLAIPSIAHANQCDAGLALLSNHEIPSGCPIRAYVRPGTALADVKVTVTRGGNPVDVTGTTTSLGAMDLPIHYDEPDFANECQSTTHVSPYSYDAYELTFTANVGETMQIGSIPYRSATVVTAGPCPAPEEYLNGSNWIQCSATFQEFQACHDQLCTPLASPQANCESTGSNDPWSDPQGDEDDDGGCSASRGSAGGSIALGGPLGLLALAFVRYRRNARR